LNYTPLNVQRRIGFAAFNVQVQHTTKTSRFQGPCAGRYFFGSGYACIVDGVYIKKRGPAFSLTSTLSLKHVLLFCT
jgi:hypothetical protein